MNGTIRILNRILKRRLLTCCLAWSLGLVCLQVLAEAEDAEETGRQSSPMSLQESQRLFFVMANLENTLAHEMGHVVLDEFDIPVLGNIEAAADQLGVFLFSSLMGGNDNFAAAKLDILQAIGDEMRLEWGALSNQDRETYWSAHPFEPQRFFNIACLIYGSSPKDMEDVREFAQIPYGRAFYCRDEYETAAQAVSWVVSRAGRETAYQDDPDKRRINVVYEQPVAEQGEHLYQWLKQSGLIESIVLRAEELFSFRRAITITLSNCQHPDAMWMSGKGEVVVCYQLLERYYYLADHRHTEKNDAVLDMQQWNAFCAHDAVAEHYPAYCKQAQEKNLAE